jgi:cytochrome c556
MARLMSKGAVLAVAVGIGAAIAAGGALAHNEAMPKGPMSPAAKAAHMRHENFEKLGAAFKTVVDETKKSEPNKAVVARATKTMNTLATALPTWFPRGSGVEARAKSEAKANIWTDAAGFSAAASASQLQVSKLNQAAISGDMNAVRAQIRATGGSCKACHDKYRLEKKT